MSSSELIINCYSALMHASQGPKILAKLMVYGSQASLILSSASACAAPAVHRLSSNSLLFISLLCELSNSS